jgi:beta-phosphoglucomutase-like phosphatase (HAD superfamily)
MVNSYQNNPGKSGGDIMKLDEIEAIFWDFDGVIADSVDVKTRAFEEMFTPYGEAVLKQVIEYHRQHGGISRVEKIDHYYRHFIGQPLSADELEEKCLIYAGLVKQKVVDAALIPGAEETLVHLHGQIPMFVISGTPQAELIEISERRNLSRYFRRILGSPIHKAEHVESLLHEFDLDRTRCVFVGDALTDLKAAEETGTRFIGIQGMVSFPDGLSVLEDCTGIIEALQAM